MKEQDKVLMKMQSRNRALNDENLMLRKERLELRKAIVRICEMVDAEAEAGEITEALARKITEIAEETGAERCRI